MYTFTIRMLPKRSVLAVLAPRRSTTACRMVTVADSMELAETTTDSAMRPMMNDTSRRMIVTTAASGIQLTIIEIGVDVTNTKVDRTRVQSRHSYSTTKTSK